MAQIFKDTFVRGNQTPWGTPSDGSADWVRVGTGGSSIVSNRGEIVGSNLEVRADTHVLTQDNNIVITFLSATWQVVGSGDTRYIMVKSNGGNRDGFGLEIGTGSSNNLTIRDSTTFPIATGSFTFTATVSYNFELDISSSYAIDIYIWDSSGAKPGTPTITGAAGARTGAGSLFELGNNGDSGSGATFRIEDLLISSNTAVVASTPMLALMGVGT